MRQFYGTLISVIAGWCAGWLFLIGRFFLTFYPHLPWDSGKCSEWFLFLLIYAVIEWLFILPVWFLVLIPLYYLVPRHSLLWRWPVCAACGTIAGGTILYLWAHYSSPQASDYIEYLCAAGLVGGVSCLVASLTVQNFRPCRAA